MIIDDAYLQQEFDNFFEFDTADRSQVTSTSARMFAKHISIPLEAEIERLKSELSQPNRCS